MSNDVSDGGNGVTAPNPDPKRCPLCGGDNACGVAAGASTCWCFSTPIPDSVREEVPAALQGVACVCASCAAGRNPSGS